MQIPFHEHIEKLLFLHDSLTIPGLGGFTANRTPTTVDQASGVIKPPAKALAFSENLAVDDGLLVQEIADRYSLSVEDARARVEAFVAGIHEQLSQREIVAFPGVGRLYKNYMQKVQFLPDAVNFNAESYGLPPLQFSSISRSREIEKPVAGETDQQTIIPPPVKPQPVPPRPVPPPPVKAVDTNYAQETRRRNPIGTALGILLLILALGAGYLAWQRLGQKDAALEPVSEEKTETPAEKKTEQSLLPSDRPETEKTVAEPEPEKIEPVSPPPVREETSEPAAVKGGKECILVVATLQEKANADRLQRQLENAGYSVYYLRKNGYQVGIRFQYQKIGEIQEKLESLQKLTGEKDIWIKKK